MYKSVISAPTKTIRTNIHSFKLILYHFPDMIFNIIPGQSSRSSRASRRLSVGRIRMRSSNSGISTCNNVGKVISLNRMSEESGGGGTRR